MLRESGLNRRRETPGGSVTEYRACLLALGGAGNPGDGALRRGMQRAGDLEDGRLMSENNHLDQAWMPGSFMCQTWWEARKQNKRRFNFCEWLLEWQASGAGMC